MIVWVWPPQTSIIAHGDVAVAWMSSSSRLARSGSENSSRYFMILSFPDATRHLRGQVGPGEPCLLRRLAPVVAELVVELTHLAEDLERLPGRLLVEALQREAHVDDRVLTDLQVRDVLQAHFLADAAEVDLRDAGPVALADLQDPSWHG